MLKWETVIAGVRKGPHNFARLREIGVFLRLALCPAMVGMPIWALPDLARPNHKPWKIGSGTSVSVRRASSRTHRPQRAMIKEGARSWIQSGASDTGNRRPPGDAAMTSAAPAMLHSAGLGRRSGSLLLRKRRWSHPPAGGWPGFRLLLAAGGGLTTRAISGLHQRLAV